MILSRLSANTSKGLRTQLTIEAMIDEESIEGLKPFIPKMILNKLQYPQKQLNKGFTLIELLVVVVIIGILSGVALPNFLNQRKRANVAAWNAQASALVSACEIAATNDVADISADTDVARLITASDTEVVTTGINASACVVTIPDTPDEVGTAGSFTMFGTKTPAIAA